MIILGINGQIESGKDTFFEFIPCQSKARLAFADPLKREVAEFLAGTPVATLSSRVSHLGNVTIPQLQAMHDERVLAHNTPIIVIGKGGSLFWADEAALFSAMHDRTLKECFRTLMQWWGTEYRRAQDPAYWIKAAQAQVHLLEGTEFVCFTDMRFPNEAQLVTDLHGHTMRLRRPITDKTGPNRHVSETALDEWPFAFIIENTEGLDELKDSACWLWDHLVK